MSGGWGTPSLEARTGSSGVFCVEPGCGLPGACTRPVREPWLYEGGVIGPDDAVEWVRDDHAGTATARSVSR